MVTHNIRELTPNNAERPHTTSLRVRTGAQPVLSNEVLRSILRHTSPDSVMFGCHSRVVHLTQGGCSNKDHYHNLLYTALFLWAKSTPMVNLNYDMFNMFYIVLIYQDNTADFQIPNEGRSDI